MHGWKEKFLRISHPIIKKKETSSKFRLYCNKILESILKEIGWEIR